MVEALNEIQNLVTFFFYNKLIVNTSVIESMP